MNIKTAAYLPNFLVHLKYKHPSDFVPVRNE